MGIKPGKPLLFANDPQGRLYFGLPGNPLSAMVGFYEFVLPALNRLAGCAPERCRPMMRVRVNKDMTIKGGRQTYVPVTLEWTPEGPEARGLDARGTADLVAGARMDGTLVIPADRKRVPSGAMLDFRSWRVLS